jgi:general secretion pathway protein F
MAVFEYRALDAKGKKQKGILDADSESQARAKLRSMGKYPVSITVTSKERTKSGGQKRGIGLFSRVKAEEISVTTRQLATLLGASIPLVQALDGLIAQTRNPMLKKVIAEIKGAVNEGNSLTNALGEHPKIFSSVFINMVRAGEASGTLDIVLDRLADFAEKQDELRGRFRAALVYPIFMGLIGSAILFILITYIVPNITQVFNEMNRVLPLPTLFLIGLSDFLKVYWWVVVIIIAGLLSGLRYFIKKPLGKRFWDYVALKSFIIGPVVQKVILARFSSTLGSLLESGVGLMMSMQIVQALVDNVHVAKVIDGAMEQIQKGQSMTVALSDSEWFPPMFIQMIAVGEQSGNLEGMLKKVSKAYEREVETAIMGMTALIEPLMIVGMGLAVGFIVLSILLPIFEMNQMIG